MDTAAQQPLGRRIAVFAYGVVSYAIFFGTFLYMIGFVGGFGVPKSIDSTPHSGLGIALLINTALLGIFAVQHSVMARPAFKRWWTRIVPQPAERSTYVLFSSIALIALAASWQPLGGVVWQIENTTARALIWALYGFGWSLVLVSTFLINHFDLFGLRQVWLYLIGRDYTPVPFTAPVLYKVVRHPLYVGWFFAFWAAPTMTAAHLFFAVVTTAYILIAIRLEERDLVSEHGERYRSYREQVPMLIPRPGRRFRPVATTASAA